MKSPNSERNSENVSWRSNSFKIYLSHALCSWGDRMWSFSIGLYLVLLHPQSLQLAAIYGFAMCISVIVFGAFVGRWIDNSSRLTAARVSVVVQNVFVILGSMLLGMMIHFEEDIKPLWNGGLEIGLFAVLIVLTIIAELASVANKIILEKDWIVVLADGNEKKFSERNFANNRPEHINSSSNVVGQIITYVSKLAGAAFIAGWNAFSGCVEFYLLHVIYSNVPVLASKERSHIPFVHIDSPTESNNELVLPTSPHLNDNMTPQKSCFHLSETGTEGVQNHNNLLTPRTAFEKTLTEVSLVTPSPSRKINTNQHQGSQTTLVSKDEDETHEKDSSKVPKPCSSSTKPMNSLKKRICDAWNGWRDYFRHPVRDAGLALSALYMTVLGFDSVTNGIAYTLGVNESVIGILMGVGALFGILGSISFAWLRGQFGKTKVGIIGFVSQTVCLLLCVGSVFATGSPFKPESLWQSSPNSTQSDPSPHSLSFSELWETRATVFYLMGGIVLSRFGLWVADLSVTQIFQEHVLENQRGILGGVQNSLNQLMNLLKFLLVILLPNSQTFGYLIFLSWAFVFIGSIFFIAFAIKENRRRKSGRVPNEGYQSQRARNLENTTTTF